MGALLRKALSFPAMLGALLLAGGFVFARLNLTDPDSWWHTRVGEHILSTGTWPTSDFYSFTVPGSDWMAYEWLGEVVMALAMRLSGLQGMAALLIGLSGVLLLLLYYYAYLRSGNVKASLAACLLLLPLAAPIFTLRPQLLGYIFLLSTLICLERFRQGSRKALWFLPGVFLLWVNTHGTFALGLAVLGLYGVSGLMSFARGRLVAERWTPEQRRDLAVVFLLCVLVLPLTPYGTRLAAYPLQMAFFQPVNIANIQEWQPLPFDLLPGKLFLGALLLFVLGQVLFPLTYRVEEIGLLLVALYAACVHRRFLIFFVLAFAPLLATLLARWVPSYQPTKDRPALNVALLTLIAAIIIGFFPSTQELEEIVAQKFPQKAVEYLRQQPVAGPMLNEYGWGGYLIWSRGPEHRVFIDGRADIYEYSGVLPDYLHITRLHPDALFLLRKYRVEACLLQREAPLGTLLSALPDWDRVYVDELSALFVHKKRHQSPERTSQAASEVAHLSTVPSTIDH